MRIFIAFTILFSVLVASPIEFSQEETQYIQMKKEPIKIGVLDTYSPFSFVKNDKVMGFSHDLLDLITQRSGLKFEKVIGPWSEIYPMFKEKKLDMISEISYREDRLSFTEFTKPYYEVPLGVFTKGFFEYEGISSLEGKRVGIIKGSFLKSILHNIKDIQIVELKDLDQKFSSLINNHVDIVISSAMSMLYIESLVYRDIKLSGYFEHPEVKKEDLRFGINKQHKILTSIINKSLESIDYIEYTKLKRKWLFSEDIENILFKFTKKEKEFIQENPTIKVSNELDWPPFDFVLNGEPQGYSIELLNLLAKKIGIKIEYINGYTWDELILMYKERKIDLLHSLNQIESRKKIGLFSDPYIRYKTHFITRSETPKIKSLKELEGKTVAVGKGWITDDFLTQYYPKIKLLRIEGGVDKILSAVSKKQAYAAIQNNMVVKHFIKKENFINLKVNSWAKEFDKNGGRMLHFMTHKDKPELISLLNKAMDSLSTEEIYRLQDKWFQGDKSIFSSDLTLQEKNFLKSHSEVRFRVRPNRAPFEFEKDGEAQGIAVDYVRKSAQNLGLKVKFVIDNSSVPEAYKTMQTTRDKFDTVLFSVKNPKWEKQLSFGDEYLSYPMMIITYKNAPFIGTLKSLNGKTVVIEKGFLTNKWLKRDYPDINIINVNDTKTALEMVNNEKVLAYIGNLGVANYMKLLGGMDNLKIDAPTEYGNIKYSFVAPKVWPELSSILTKGYKKITPVEHSAIQQKWFSLQTIDKTNYNLIGSILLILIFIILWILWWNRKITIEKNKTKLALADLQKVKEELEQKNKEVYDSQQFLQSIIDENPNPIIIKNYEGKFVLVNQALANLYNTTKENMIGKEDRDFVDNTKLTKFYKHNVKQIMDSGKAKVVYEDSQNVATGEIRNFVSIKKPFIDMNGEQAILIIANDITDIKKLEQEKLRHQEILFSQSKVAAMGEMIGNIAHQWRQPLSVISTSATGLIMEKEVGLLSDEKLVKSLESINDYAQYLSNTIDTFRDYIKTEKEYKEVILQERIKVALNIVEASFKNNFINIKSNLDTLEPIKIKLVVGELSEVLINLFNNAKDALKEKQIDIPWVDIQINPYDDKVLITVEDNAGGIPTEIMGKIFDPYFTTKHQSQGTGLGLHMSYKIITDSLKGKIYVENTQSGAKFTIELPLA
jgi:PAS domain S-box-containing protein